MADLSSLQLRQLWVTPGSPGSALGCSKLLEAEGPLIRGDLPVLFSTLTSRGRAPARGCPGTGKFSPQKGSLWGRWFPISAANSTETSCRSQYGKLMAICCNSSFPLA